MNQSLPCMTFALACILRQQQLGAKKSIHSVNFRSVLLLNSHLLRMNLADRLQLQVQPVPRAPVRRGSNCTHVHRRQHRTAAVAANRCLRPFISGNCRVSHHPWRHDDSTATCVQQSLSHAYVVFTSSCSVHPVSVLLLHPRETKNVVTECETEKAQDNRNRSK